MKEKDRYFHPIICIDAQNVCTVHGSRFTVPSGKGFYVFSNPCSEKMRQLSTVSDKFASKQSAFTVFYWETDAFQEFQETILKVCQACSSYNDCLRIDEGLGKLSSTWKPYKSSEGTGRDIC